MLFVALRDNIWPPASERVFVKGLPSPNAEPLEPCRLKEKNIRHKPIFRYIFFDFNAAALAILGAKKKNCKAKQ